MQLNVQLPHIGCEPTSKTLSCSNGTGRPQVIHVKHSMCQYAPAMCTTPSAASSSVISAWQVSHKTAIIGSSISLVRFATWPSVMPLTRGAFGRPNPCQTTDRIKILSPVLAIVTVPPAQLCNDLRDVYPACISSRMNRSDLHLPIRPTSSAEKEGVHPQHQARLSAAKSSLPY